MARKENRGERIDRLKNKFRSLSRIRKLQELLRYNRALRGELPIPPGVPRKYLEECHEALKDLVIEEFEPGTLGHFLELMRLKPSKPFSPPGSD
ncbi:MAG: hypothetical protein AAB692_04535 [Patescibacteria group bacterium]